MRITGLLSGAKLLLLSSGGLLSAACCRGGAGEQPVQLAGNGAFEATADLAVALALDGAPGHIPLGGLVVAQPHQHDPVQRSVGLAVPTPVEAVPDGLAGGRLDR